MAGNFNKVLLMGNLTRDVELRYTQNNTAIGKFGLAVNRRFSVGEGASREQREEVTFVDCEAWGRAAEVISQYLHKGNPIFIEGRLKLDQWEDKNGGGKRSRLLVVVENFQFIGAKDEGGGGGGAPAGGRRTGGAPASRGAAQSYDELPPDDDIPF
ncbi:MAG: single-stranded DNA-binding protein [Phycisphaerales bacterium]|nr:single-stranded DNA-binding protein [Phycisphaerales bacterium]